MLSGLIKIKSNSVINEVVIINPGSYEISISLTPDFTRDSRSTLCANATTEEYTLTPYEILDIAVLPEPEIHPIPPVNSRFIGAELAVKLTINEKGKPSLVRLTRPLVSYNDVHLMSLAGQMQDMVRSWKFSPAEDAQGNPVKVKAILPIRIVEKDEAPAIMASLVLDTRGTPRS